MRAISGDLAMRARKPLVAVPDDCRCFDTAGRAVIAWDGSAPVMATMEACVPLLKLAASVRLFTVDDGSEAIPAEEAAAYLSRHDIHATIERIRGDRHGHADVLISEQCHSFCADYCLMGAFSRGRLTEAVFGGVTRSMLTNAKLPLVLGH
jgi:nucleotide-binding universal stress UspA family protein